MGIADYSEYDGLGLAELVSRGEVSPSELVEEAILNEFVSLSGGKLRGHAISCPLHGARFDVRTGECLAAPASQPIKSFPVTLEGGKVLVALDNGTGR